jgi:hypothetical protein
MRNRRVLCETDHQQRDTPPAAQFVIQVLPPGGEAPLVILPLIYDHARAPACYAALLALARQWLEEPSALARSCELDRQTLQAPAGSTAGPPA